MGVGDAVLQSCCEGVFIVSIPASTISLKNSVKLSSGLRFLPGNHNLFYHQPNLTSIYSAICCIVFRRNAARSYCAASGYRLAKVYVRTQVSRKCLISTDSQLRTIKTFNFKPHSAKSVVVSAYISQYFSRINVCRGSQTFCRC